MTSKQSEILGDVSDLLTLLNFLNVKDTSMKNLRCLTWIFTVE